MKLHRHKQIQRHAVDVSLDSGIHISVPFHPDTNLPTLQLSTHRQSSFWTDAFSFHETNESTITVNLSAMYKSNKNLSVLQKEFLLWHQQLSHLSNSWLQTLMRERKWISKYSYKSALKETPIIITKESFTPSCDISNLLCSSCLSAKSKTRSPDISTTSKHPNK